MHTPKSHLPLFALALVGVALLSTPAAAQSAYTRVENNGTDLAKQYQLNCLPPLTCADTPERHATTITLDGGALTLTADLTAALGGGEQWIWNKTTTDATADEGIQLNYTALDTTSGTTAQHALSITNIASTEGADALIELDNADADDNVISAIRFSNPSRFTSHFDTTGALVIGSATVTGISFSTDGTGVGELTFPADSINLDDFEDTLALDADLTLTIGGGEQFIGNKAATDGAAADYGFELNYTALDTGSASTTQYAAFFNNVASTEAADALIRVSNADADDAVVTGLSFGGTGTFTNEITLQNGETIDGQTAATVMFGRNDAGAVTLSSKDNDADADLVFDAGGTGVLTFNGTISSTNSGVCTLNGATPSVCTDTVKASSVCVCASVGASAAIAAAGCAVGLSGTTLTITSANSATNDVNWMCW